MSDQLSSVFPRPATSDGDDVVWTLQTAAVQWQRGLRADAIVWVRRAADTAVQSGQVSRGEQLREQAARLAEFLWSDPRELSARGAAAPPGGGADDVLDELEEEEILELEDFELEETAAGTRPSEAEEITELTLADFDEEGAGDSDRTPPDGTPLPADLDLSAEGSDSFISINPEDDDGGRDSFLSVSPEEDEGGRDSFVSVNPEDDLYAGVAARGGSLSGVSERPTQPKLGHPRPPSPSLTEHLKAPRVPTNVRAGRAREPFPTEEFPGGPPASPSSFPPPPPSSRRSPPEELERPFGSSEPVEFERPFGSSGPVEFERPSGMASTVPPEESPPSTAEEPIAPGFAMPHLDEEPAIEVREAADEEAGGDWRSTHEALTAPAPARLPREAVPTVSEPTFDPADLVPTLEPDPRDSVQGERSEADPGGAKAGTKEPEGPARVGDVVLEDTEILADLPEDAHRELAAGAEQHRLEAGSAFILDSGAALVVQGSVYVTLSGSEVSATRLSTGAVVSVRGSLGPRALRLLCGPEDSIVATWTQEQLDAAMHDCPWVVDDLSALADRLHAHAGAGLGALGARLDDALRGAVYERLEVRVVEAGAQVAQRGKALDGLWIVAGGGMIARADGAETMLAPGEFVYAECVIGAQPVPCDVLAGSEGALALYAKRAVAHELMMSVPPLLEILAS